MSTRIEMGGGIVLMLFSTFTEANKTCKTFNDGLKPAKLTFGYVIKNKTETRDEDGCITRELLMNDELRKSFERDLYKNKKPTTRI